MVSLESSKLEDEQLLAAARLVAASRRRSARVGSRSGDTACVLALQGGFEAHERMLERLGRASRARCGCPADLEGLDGLVHPGRGVDDDDARASSARGWPRRCASLPRAGVPCSAPAPG